MNIGRNAADALKSRLNIAYDEFPSKRDVVASPRIRHIPYGKLRNNLSDQKQLFVDGSPTKEKRHKAWLWVAVAPLFTVFGIFPNRKRESLVKLIDCSDHTMNRLGYDLQRQQKLLFRHWRRSQADEITWKEFQDLADPIRDEFNGLLLRGRYSGNARLTGSCDELWPRRDHLWTFIEIPGIEPTSPERPICRSSCVKSHTGP